jgi:adenosylmethionine-8-amino-7-oxononanoate aminotransferase
LRTKIVSRLGSYHGSTIGTLSATGIAAFKSGLGPLAPDFLHAPQPHAGGNTPGRDRNAWWLECIAETAALIEREGPETIAAIIAEPVAIPGSVKIPHRDYFVGLRKLCDEHGMLLIVDEVVCGFGRTGRLFGASHFDVRGDIVTYAKGLTSGYIPMGAVAVSRKVEEPFKTAPLLHLNTYAGHPVACVSALAAQKLTENAAAMEPVLRGELERLSRTMPRVREIAVIGLLSSVVCDISDQPDPDATLRKARKEAYDAGLLARFARDGNNLSAHFYPPLVVDKQDIRKGVLALEKALLSL